MMGQPETSSSLITGFLSPGTSLLEPMVHLTTQVLLPDIFCPLVIIPVAPMITGMTKHFKLQIR